MLTGPPEIPISGAQPTGPECHLSVVHLLSRSYDAVFLLSTVCRGPGTVCSHVTHTHTHACCFLYRSAGRVTWPVCNYAQCNMLPMIVLFLRPSFFKRLQIFDYSAPFFDYCKVSPHLWSRGPSVYPRWARCLNRRVSWWIYNISFVFLSFCGEVSRSSSAQPLSWETRLPRLKSRLQWTVVKRSLDSAAEPALLTTVY